MIKIPSCWLVAVLVSSTTTTTTTAFSPSSSLSRHQQQTSLFGYLDDLSRELHAPDPNPDPVAESREATKLDKSKVDRAGVGDWSTFVDFDEFDGGDGQMGVAGDGNKGLEKEWQGAAEMAKSKTMSAKNAWGKSTGYADTLIEQGVEATRAQQMENWKNQQEVQQERNQHRVMTEQFDQIQTTADEDWRKLASFGVERNQDFNMDETFGAVVPGGMDQGVIELTGRSNAWQVFEFSLKNPFMGFSDFRAAFTAETNTQEWSVEPTEGSLNGRGNPTEFFVKFRPSRPGLSEGYLVVETEDDKWTWKLMGTGSM